MRAELNIPWSVATWCRTSSAAMRPMLERLGDQCADTRPHGQARRSPLRRMPCRTGSAQIVVGGVTIAFPLGGAIDLDAENARACRRRSRRRRRIAIGLAARLANPAFTERAKPEAVEKARADHDARAAEAERLAAALARLG